jgi:hypothetical protein
MAGKGFWRWYDRGARVDFGATLLALVFDWKPWVFGFGSSAVTFIGTANQGWDPWAVWLAALAAGAFVALIVIAVRLRKSSEPGVAAVGDEKTNDAPVADAESIRLAGIVNGLMEQALQYGFKMTAVQPSDQFAQLYQDVKNSTDPVWIDNDASQLRRDLLQFCAVVGSDERGVKELQSDRAKLRDYGEQLIAKLTGKSRRVAAQATPAIAKIEFKWTPGGMERPYEIRAIATPHQNLKNFVLLGALATANHYVDGGCKWIWEPAFRLLKPTDLFKGEVRGSQILFCWRTVTPVAHPIVIFEKKTPELKDNQLLMLRVSAISDSGTVHHQEAYQVRKIGNAIILDPIHQDHIAYIEGANDGL